MSIPWWFWQKNGEYRARRLASPVTAFCNNKSCRHFTCHLKHSSNAAKTAPTRRMNLENIAGFHLGLADMVQLLDLAAGAHHEILSDLARLATRHAEGAVLAAVGQDAGRHRLQESD